jgi:hypothetical protein
MVSASESLRDELRTLRAELRGHDEAGKAIAMATKDCKAASDCSKEIVSTLVDSAFFNWLTIGMVVGIALGILAGWLPVWATVTAVVFGIALLQLIARFSWQVAVEKSGSTTEGG